MDDATFWKIQHNRFAYSQAVFGVLMFVQKNVQILLIFKGLKFFGLQVFDFSKTVSRNVNFYRKMGFFGAGRFIF